MTERDFDILLEQSVPELPPNDVAQEVTPWRSAMGYVIAGCCLTTVSLDFWSLSIFLPLIGTVCMLLGFRALRRENGWFGACFLLSILSAVPSFTSFVLEPTIYSLESLLPADVLRPLVYARTALGLALFFCLWRGLLAVQKKAGVEPHAGSAAALCVWYLIITALGLLGVTHTEWFFALVLIGCYVLILKCLSSLSDEIEEGGYVLTPSSVRISDGALVGGIVAVLVLASLIGALFFSRYPMDWRTADESLSAEATEIRAELLALGYPEAALDDLTEADLLACRGAMLVVVHETDEPMNNGREVRTTSGNRTHITTVYDVKELHLTDVGVCLAGSPEEWRIFHHFRWTEDVKFHGTECIQLRPAYNSGDWDISGYKTADPTGRVLYTDASGVTHTAPYAAITEEHYSANSFFWSGRTYNDLFAVFSFPARGTAQRGYLTYGFVPAEGRWTADSWLYYVHQKSALQYPVQTAAEHRRSGAWHSRVFKTVSDNLLFYRLEDGSIMQWHAG